MARSTRSSSKTCRSINALWLAGASVAFLLHPVSLHAVTHVAQRGEIVGLFFGLCAIWLYLRLENPWLTAAATLPAVLSKESAAVLPLLLTVLGAWKYRNPAWTIAAALSLATCVWGASQNSFSSDIVQNEVNHLSSIAFRKAVAAGEEVPPALSTILPIRTRTENFRFQSAILPEVIRIHLLPFGIVQDLGHFPWGRDSESQVPRRAAFGIILFLIVASLIGRFIAKNPARPKTHPLLYFGLLGILASWAVVWIFPVYDAFLAYRYYVPCFLAWVIVLPALFQSQEKLFQGAVLLVVLAGALRATEIKTPLSAAQHELDRQPFHYRNHVQRVRSLISAGDRGVGIRFDCGALLKPALTLAPSAALIEIEWAFCARSFGLSEESKVHARRSLEFDSVPENVQVAVTYLLAADGRLEIPTEKIHPNNMKHLALQRAHQNKGPDPFRDPAPCCEIRFLTYFKPLEWLEITSCRPFRPFRRRRHVRARERLSWASRRSWSRW